MNIFSISGILPIPNFIKHNDFVFKLYNQYQKKYPYDNVFIARPIQYSNIIVSLFSPFWKVYYELCKKRYYSYDNYKVYILKYISIKKFMVFHSIFSYTIYLFNKNCLKEIISKNKIDIVHAQYIFPDGLLAYLIYKKYKIPYIVGTHNELKYFNHYISRKIAIRILNKAKAICPINFTNYRYLKKNNIKNLHLIPLGIDRFFLEQRKRKESEYIRILTVADLIKLKNIDKVIEAITNLKEKYKLKYTIIGNGSERQRLGILVEKLKLQNDVVFIYKINHLKMAKEMSKYDIFIMPSYFETFGRVYFEAMAVGLPIICAKNSGIYGYFDEMKEGISVNHTDINDIEAKLELLIKNKTLRKEISRNGKKLVLKYTWQKIAQKYHQIYYS